MVNKLYTFLRTTLLSIYYWFSDILCLRPKSNDLEDPELGKIIHSETMDSDSYNQASAGHSNQDFSPEYGTDDYTNEYGSEHYDNEGYSGAGISMTYAKDYDTEFPELVSTPRGGSSEDYGEHGHDTHNETPESELDDEPEVDEDPEVEVPEDDESLLVHEESEPADDASEVTIEGLAADGQELAASDDENETESDQGELKMESFEGEEMTIPTPSSTRTAPAKKLGTKLNWEANPSVPKYSLIMNSKIKTEDITKDTVTAKGKAALLMQAQVEKNQSKVKLIKNDFRRELEEKRQADAQARLKIVEAERARVAAAKIKKEKMAEKVRLEAAARYQKEKGEKLKMRSELEAKRQEISSAKVKAIQSSKA